MFIVSGCAAALELLVFSSLAILELSALLTLLELVTLLTLLELTALLTLLELLELESLSDELSSLHPVSTRTEDKRRVEVMTLKRIETPYMI